MSKPCPAVLLDPCLFNFTCDFAHNINMYRITLHSYMHYHHIAFLYVSPSYCILTCITITLHLNSLMHYHAFHFHQKSSFHLFCPEISNCLLDARSELEGCLRRL